jgi:3-deoxy-alpha-D-manno-octulosonate 8-oxidase
MTSILDSGIKLVKNVGRYNTGSGSIKEVGPLLAQKRMQAKDMNKSTEVVYLVDEFFRSKVDYKNVLHFEAGDLVYFISTVDEPKTNEIDSLVSQICADGVSDPCAIVGMGGGITMDTAKAISNLLTNGGKAEQYQGWDLLKVPGIFKLGIPTISGTGSEATRTCVMTNSATGLKLGMNSDYTVFDHVIMDSDLTKTVPRAQYFYTGMDAYIHCVEALSGSYRNAIGDSYSRETLNLCRQVFFSDDMQSNQNRDSLMVASYLGGCSIATSYVGVVHPFSAGLSVVLGLHHCIANCIVMRAMEEFYPDAYKEFWVMVDKQKISIPQGICHDLNEDQYRQLYASTIIHQKPLTNALGEGYKKLLTQEKVIELFLRM